MLAEGCLDGAGVCAEGAWIIVSWCLYLLLVRLSYTMVEVFELGVEEEVLSHGGSEGCGHFVGGFGGASRNKRR